MQDNDAVITARHMPPCALAVMCSSYPVDGIEPSSRYILVGSSADSWCPSKFTWCKLHLVSPRASSSLVETKVLLHLAISRHRGCAQCRLKHGSCQRNYMYVRCAPERIVMARGAAMGGARVRGWVHCPGCQVKSSLQQQQLRYLGGYAVSWPGCSRQP